MRHDEVVGRAELGRVIDREALEAARGARGRLRVEVPAAWARSGAQIAITCPSRVCCAACDGGGCDACARSGAHRLAAEPDARTLRLGLPPRLDGGVALRLSEPFGEGGPLEQLLVEIAPGGAPSPGVTRMAAPGPAAGLRGGARGAAVVAALVAVAAAVAALLASR